MTLTLDDKHGRFEIDILDKDLEEIDILRLAADAGTRAATYLKTALGHDKMLELITDQVQATCERWKQYVADSDGEYLVRSTRYHVTGISLDDFWSYFQANGGRDLQFKMHPEHYISNFSDGLGGQVMIAEPWGSALVLSHATFSDPETLRTDGHDVDALLEEDAKHRVCALGRFADGTYLCTILHQLIPAEDGFVFKTGTFLPKALPTEVLEGIEAHGVVEFTNLLRVARNSIVGADQ